ncbi:hypothetical protein FRC04_011670 [Tulasnella sp. 424]|nr:hypothetical protein FRC04_011670 [Tulasnella sp. 424]KAG8971488.1 hypothetical protein FRC05_011061 [Tulasnella sp. 425]
MDTLNPNPLNAHVFEIPDPPEEFGQDGGKFYRCYDDLADEIDDDMVTGLKEQLEGLLIFAGLFAGINTAFLALTLPMLSADSSDDTNALLAQNNALLTQLVTGRNDSVPTMSPLPSAGFSPARDIFIINALFALSLAFAIISSFLAVLGRQWLVYYRKRSGGGPDKQRWEQLKRFLGAERWRLQTILDDVLPSLLQIGLIIFCVSLIIYLRYLSPTIAIIVGVPMYVGLAFFVGSALCTLWDKFCPFHSPLSHTLLGVRTIFASGAIRRFKWQDLISADTTKRWFHALVRRREEESLESLQIITLKRAICTSDDPATLLHATANILGISNPTQMALLWSDSDFRERFSDQFKNSYARVLLLRGRDKVGIAVAARRLYCGVAAHIMLLLDSNRGPACDLTEVQTAKEAMVSTTQDGHSECSAGLVRATLRFPVPKLDRSSLPDEAVMDIGSHLITYSGSIPDPDPDRRLFFVIMWAVFDLHSVRCLKMESPPQPYGCTDVEGMIQTLDKAFKVLTGPEGGDLVDGEAVLMNMLRGIRQIFVRSQSSFTLHHKFALLEICEPILKSPRVSDAMREVIRDMRLDLSQAWQRKCALRAANKHITTRLVDMLEQYLAGLRPVYQADSGCNEYLEVLQAFGPGIRRLFSYDPKQWASTAGMRARIAFHKNFNAFVYDVDRLSRKIQV